MSDERITRNACDYQRVVLWAAGTNDDGISRTQPIERSDTDFVEVRPNFAEEDFSFFEL